MNLVKCAPEGQLFVNSEILGQGSAGKDRAFVLFCFVLSLLRYSNLFQFLDVDSMLLIAKLICTFGLSGRSGLVNN